MYINETQIRIPI